MTHTTPEPTITYRVVFGRIGRRYDIPPLDVTPTGTGDEYERCAQIAEAVYTYSRPYLLSSDIHVAVDIHNGRGAIYAGFHNAGTFTFTKGPTST